MILIVKSITKCSNEGNAITRKEYRYCVHNNVELFDFNKSGFNELERFYRPFLNASPIGYLKIDATVSIKR